MNEFGSFSERDAKRALGREATPEQIQMWMTSASAHYEECVDKGGQSRKCLVEAARKATKSVRGSPPPQAAAAPLEDEEPQ